MPKEPNSAGFCCETCGARFEVDARMGNHLLPWKRKLPIASNGTCRSCGGGSWTISVLFAESTSDVGLTAIGLGLAATTGVGFVPGSTTHVNEADYPNVSADVVAALNQDPATRMGRIGEFATIRERERLKQLGAQECATCGTLFVRAEGKPWSEKGYCCKVCAVKKEGAFTTAVGDERASNPRHTNAVPIRCACGHQFDVSISFRGLLRPCPECGTKTRVP